MIFLKGKKKQFVDIKKKVFFPSSPKKEKSKNNNAKSAPGRFWKCRHPAISTQITAVSDKN
jgi:hypothetical protein